MAAAPSPAQQLQDLLVTINRDRYIADKGGPLREGGPSLPLSSTPLRPFKQADDLAATDTMLQFTMKQVLPRVLAGVIGYGIGQLPGAAAGVVSGDVIGAIHGKSRRVDELLDAANYIPQVGWAAGAAAPFAMAKGLKGLNKDDLAAAVWGMYEEKWLGQLAAKHARAGLSKDDLINTGLTSAVEADAATITTAAEEVAKLGQTPTHETVGRWLIENAITKAAKKEMDYERRFKGVEDVVGGGGDEPTNAAEAVANIQQHSATLRDDAVPIMKPESGQEAERAAAIAAQEAAAAAEVEVANRLRGLPPHLAAALAARLQGATSGEVADALSANKASGPTLSSRQGNTLINAAMREAKFREQAKSEHPAFVDVNAAGFKKNTLMGYGEGTVRRAITDAPLTELERKAAHQFFFGSGYTTSHNIDRQLKTPGVTQSAKQRIADWLQSQR